jgi:hypothetical protein
MIRRMKELIEGKFEKKKERLRGFRLRKRVGVYEGC